MREGGEFKIRKDGSSNADGSFDWNASGDEILKALDEVLKGHGLEIVTHDTAASFYAFSIKKVRRGKKGRQQVQNPA
jgi:hypothetical protein